MLVLGSKHLGSTLISSSRFLTFLISCSPVPGEFNRKVSDRTKLNNFALSRNKKIGRNWLKTVLKHESQRHSWQPCRNKIATLATWFVYCVVFRYILHRHELNLNHVFNQNLFFLSHIFFVRLSIDNWMVRLFPKLHMYKIRLSKRISSIVKLWLSFKYNMFSEDAHRQTIP